MLQEEAAYDAMLLLDRAMSAPEPAAEGRLALGAAACLAAALRNSPAPPSPGALAGATGFPEGLLGEVGAAVRASLGGDTATLSALRCLKLYLRRLGAHRPDGSCDPVRDLNARAATMQASYIAFLQPHGCSKGPSYGCLRPHSRLPAQQKL